MAAIEIAYNFAESATSALESVILDDTRREALLDHGCWCPRLNLENADQFASLGGSARDPIDQACKNWIAARNCNDRYQGGSCYENPMEDDYTVAISGSDYQCSANDNCGSDSCDIDFHFSMVLQGMLDQTVFGVNDTVWAGHIDVLSGGGSCIRAEPRVFNEPECQGDAPDGLQVVDANPTPAVAPADAAVANRVEAAGGATCQHLDCLSVTLIWDNRVTQNDLDMHMITPSGEQLYYANSVVDGGRLDIDAIRQLDPVENIIFDNNPPRGTYTIKVHNFRGGAKAFTVYIQKPGSSVRQAYNLAMTDSSRQMITVDTFTI